MTEIGKKLTDVELNSLLTELEQDYPGLTSDRIVQIQQEEAEELNSVGQDNKLTSDDAWGWARKQDTVSVKQFEPALKSIARASARVDSQKAKLAKELKAKERKKRKLEIVNEAINSTFVDLNAPLTISHKKLLITLLTKHYTEKMEHHSSYINSAFDAAFRKAIPHDLLNTYYKFKDTMLPFPGFTYIASKEYGQGLPFIVTLDLPLYFKPDDCNGIIRELLPANRLASLDKAVAFFHKYKSVRSKQEIKIAEALMKISSFYQLVKKDAFWYDTLITELKSLQNGL